jgi:sugar-specific transcriptional regulator TrmB
MLQNAFQELGLSEIHVRIYSSLVEYGPSSARQLAERLDINRPTVYEYLKALMKKGLVMDRFEETKNLYQIDDPKQISRLLDEKMERLAKEKESLVKELPAFLKHAESIDPKFKFYSGQEGARQALNQVVYSGEKEVLVMYSIEDVTRLLGHENMLEINEKRVRNKMRARGIWTYTDKLDELNKKYNRLDGKDSMREVRMAPKEMTELKMGYWLAGNTAAFISTKREAYGFVIRSHDFADFLRAQFEMIWSVSKLIVK